MNRDKERETSGNDSKKKKRYDTVRNLLDASMLKKEIHENQLNRARDFYISIYYLNFVRVCAHRRRLMLCVSVLLIVRDSLQSAFC